MGSIRSRKASGKLFIDFRYRNVRCREQTLLEDTPANRRTLQKLLDRIEAEITLGTFDYERYFPGSKKADQFNKHDQRISQSNSDKPVFKDFAELWYSEMEPQWRKSYKHNIRQTLNKYLIPEFGEHLMDQITKADLLAFRGVLARPDNDRQKALSPSRINHVMTPLRMILTEAADRYDFVSPWRNIKPFKVPRTHVEPFDIEEVLLIINTVRPDFKSYYTVRFFTGLRTSEIDGLKWQYVDFKRRQILIREALVMGEMGYTKNDGSFRTVDMSDIVYDALKAQAKVTKNNEFVFSNKAGKPLSHGDITKKVWHPLLRHLGLTKRRPYQTRHTAATLWLAAGESPEWIAMQMGHTTTEMLFTVYSRYVPNLTRKDGSAFEQLINSKLDNKSNPLKEG